MPDYKEYVHKAAPVPSRGVKGGWLLWGYSKQHELYDGPSTGQPLLVLWTFMTYRNYKYSFERGNNRVCLAPKLMIFGVLPPL